MPDPEGSKYPEYRLTEKGADLATTLIALMQWGDHWASPPAGPPVEVIELATGEPIAKLEIRNRKGRALSLAELSYRKRASEVADHAPLDTEQPEIPAGKR
jgi:hypothetical protein